MTFIIAEIGINHNGSLDVVKKLIDVAHECGCDAVKFQKRTVEIVYAGQLDTPRESPWGKTLGDQKRGLEFGRDEYDAIDKHCREVGIPWFASAWDIPSLEFLRRYDLPYNKIASAMVTNHEFVEAVGSERKPVFLSTAMCTMEDIDAAMDRLDDCAVTLMHCVGEYPAPDKILNLKAMVELMAYGAPVGYSGHEVSVSPSVIAVALGAVAVERHVTLDRSMYGSDQAASLEPAGLRTLVEQIRKVPLVLGDGVKRITDGEKIVAKKLRYWSNV